MNNQEHSLWVEKYRPKELKDYVGNEHFKGKVQRYLDTNDIPHLLFHGKAGTGKTTISKLIINTVECDYMLINASDENNVDTVRSKIKTFASTIGFKPIKIIVLDEFDYMSQNAQASLRNLMEAFSKTCRFILTCNYLDKVIDPIKSRCQVFEVIPPSKKDIAIQISKILGSENVTFEPKDLVPIVDSSYPDIRKVINTCQLNSVNGKLRIDENDVIANDYKYKIIDIIKSNDDKRNKFVNIRKVLSDARVTDYTDLFTILFEQVDDYGKGNVANIILELSDGQYKMVVSNDKEIPTVATIINILNILN